ncbi:MAG: 4-alpha-glucanotransferase [Spirochaeta sp.]|nr:4-alpha-glucanotransferase [Spirochaeta sp.]
MKYPHTSEKITGILIPPAGLRSKDSIGCGEFADLRLLGEWCAETGIRLIQLLPVNDTGSESSPYSALSANALHPLYIRITELPEYTAAPPDLQKKLNGTITAARQRFEPTARFDYAGVLTAKMEMLRELFDATDPVTSASGELNAFLRANPWVKAYAIFRALKNRNEERSWTEWESERDIDAAGITRLWKRRDLTGDTRFYAWLQLRLAQQFAGVAEELDTRGIALKGDIPILMNEDSADAWYDRDIFRPELRAGAPPDMFSALGQNWGFPIYNWERLAERDYDWWRNRLKHAARYYHAYRIDHVLGFFRIWAVPAGNYSGIPGFFWPQHGITDDEWRDAGFDTDRITWLREPHIDGAELREHLNGTVDELIGPVFQQLDGEDLFRFAPEISGEQELADLALTEDQRGWVLEQYRDRALVRLPDGTHAPTWTFRECSRYNHLNDTERDRFEALVAHAGVASNELWADHGHHVLEVMKESSDMLPCAEDLGVVPEAVPRVLERLGILGLNIPRWTYSWDAPGQPIIPFGEYPELSVCAPSVHDTSTMRGWWENEEGREDLWEMLGMDGPCPAQFDPATARQVYRAMLHAPSRIVVFALQDLLALSPEVIHDDPEQERVNVPGTYNDFNWTWRMPLTLEELRHNPTLSAEVSALTAIRTSGLSPA